MYTVSGSSQFTILGEVNLLEAIVSSEENVKCQDLMSRIVCNFYLPPCGNSIGGSHLPLSLCKEECEFVMDRCSNLWVLVYQRTIEQGLTVIDCNDTSRHFQELPTCCSDFGININGRFLKLEVSSYVYM